MRFEQGPIDHSAAKPQPKGMQPTCFQGLRKFIAACEQFRLLQCREECEGGGGHGLGSLALLFCLLLPSCTQKPVTDLQCYPPSINLSGAQARQRIVVQGGYGDEVTRDVTTQARCWIADPRLARFEKGAVLALADGKTELRV